MGREYLHKSWEKVGSKRRLLLVCLVVIPALIASGFMALALPHRGTAGLELPLLLFFAILYAWVSIGFWASLAGFFSLLRRHDRFLVTGAGEETAAAVGDAARTAILIPVYNETVDRVVAGLYAIYRSLQQAGRLELFDFFILSDSTDPDRWVEEEAAWRELCRSLGGQDRIFYRNRRVNIKRKSGNIADFCRRWGHGYRYMVVLDADSVMSGATLIRLVAAMEAHPHVGILQTAPRTVNGATLFGRLQQFASHLYTAVFAAGLHFWQLGDAQYWGHNAIIRIEPFMRHCALPSLSGKPPLGGPILSHDFVEAALMRKAGWGVWLAHDLGGSYEEGPPTLLDELKRDRRWCQGNMQHLRLLFTKGIFPAHRTLFLTGAMAYVSGLLWFLFLLLSTGEAIYESLVPPAYFPAEPTLFPEWPVWNPAWAIILGVSTLVLLFFPKILSVALIVIKERRGGEFGGLGKMVLSAAIEVLLSTLLAPIRMMFHSKFVFSILAGRQVGWQTQQRDDHTTSWSEAFRFHGSGMVLGLIWAVTALLLAPSFFWWLTPILLALIVSVPLSVWSSRTAVGGKFREMGIFLTPVETNPPRELRSLESYRERCRTSSSPLALGREAGFCRAVLDPEVHGLHLSLSREKPCLPEAIRRERRQLGEKALALGPEALTRAEKKTLLSDPAVLHWLHEAVWATTDESLAKRWGLIPRATAPLSYTISMVPERQDLIAYFSMEFALRESIPTYSGGLGVLAGDTVRSFADLGLPVIAVSLLSERGYFHQKLDTTGRQLEYDNVWSAGNFMSRLDLEVELTIQGRPVFVTAWACRVAGATGETVPVLFLDTNLEKNAEEDRLLTSYLFGGDREYRLKQEIVLGIGGMRILRQLNRHPRKYHMNEGHTAFLTLHLYHELGAVADPYERLEIIRNQCAFTTHTPVSSGHDVFEPRLVEQCLPFTLHPEILKMAEEDGKFNMTRLALVFSGYVNAVSARHREVSAAMFPRFTFDSVTNGVHSATWINPHLAQVLDRHGIGWRANPFELRCALRIPLDEIKTAHAMAKKELLDYVNVHENAGLEYDCFTIGFARRMTGYKRADLLFLDPETLESIHNNAGRLQVIYAGKAHRLDEEGKKIIAGIVALAKSLEGRIRVAFVQDYNMHVAKLMTAGVDLWLNTPRRPLEACGTSGMKAAHNGVPSLSILDGWWLEGWLEGVTGWAIGGIGSIGRSGEEGIDPEQEDALDGASLYDQLGKVIIPLYYRKPEEYLAIMRSTIAINGAYFNTARMVNQYLVRAYDGEQKAELLRSAATAQHTEEPAITGQSAG